MRNNRNAVGAKNSSDIAKDLRVPLPWLTAADRQRFKRANRAQDALGSTGVHEVLYANIGIEPISRRNLAAAAHAEENLVGNVGFRQAHFLGASAIHLKNHFGQVGGLLDTN